MKNLPKTACLNGEALIVFLKYPEPGLVKTRLAAGIGDINAANVYRKLAERIIVELEQKASEFSSVIFFDPPDAGDEVREWLQPLKGNLSLMPQIVGMLGERMADAFDRTFAIPGTRKVVIIGTDCPAVDAATITNAFEALDHHSAVIGPAVDGGYYLLGLTTNSPWLFKGVSWSTSRVLTQTISQLQLRQVSYTLLPEQQDIDTWEDLHILWPAWRQEMV